jgi:Tol biopolymer transport system component
MNPPRRLTNNETDDEPFDWTPDSQAVLFDSDRNGPHEIFKQGIREDAAQPLTTGPLEVIGPHVTPDGAWILYIEYPEGLTSRNERLMRIPISGGAPQLVLEMRSGWHMCARAPASLCVISEPQRDSKQVTITAFDPLKGRGKVLLTLPTEPGDNVVLSPDGHILASARNNGPEFHIRLLSLLGGSEREITVKGWPNITGLDWSPDGKGIYCGSISAQGSGAVLYVDLAGKVRALWQHKLDIGGQVWAIRSPDGRYLAISAETSNSNAWMLEGF